MNQPAARKLAWLAGFLDEFERAFEVVPLGRYAQDLKAAPHLPLRAPRFNPGPDPYAARFGPADAAAGGGGMRKASSRPTSELFRVGVLPVENTNIGLPPTNASRY
jgi:hypothetical protein